MKFYIVDDDPAIPMILQGLIEQNGEHSVVGIANDSSRALSEIILMDVDIVLVDLLMPEISGIDLIKRIKVIKPNLRFVMISQVRDTDLRAEAYEAGIDFFIDKPINVVEVKTVINKVAQNIEMESKLMNIQSLIGATGIPTNISKTTHHNNRDKILSILRFLGISSETGSSDIISICQIMIDQDIPFREIDFNNEFKIDDQEKKILFQRIRRAIKTGLTNIAHMCLDDMGDELVMEYANSLYEYKNVRSEIKYLEGSSSTGGKVSLRHFFDGLSKEI